MNQFTASIAPKSTEMNHRVPQSPTAEDEWTLVGGCHGCWLVPTAQLPDYLQAQAYAAVLGLLIVGVFLLINA